MASKHRPGGDPVQMHSAGDYYPVVVAVIDTVRLLPHGMESSRRYEIFHDDELEVRYSPEEAEQAAREMHARITPPSGCVWLPVTVERRG